MNKIERTKFGEKLKSIRVNMTLTQKELSERSGFSQNAISQWENGKREPESLNDLKILADSLGIPASYFLDDNQDAVTPWQEEWDFKKEDYDYYNSLNSKRYKEIRILNQIRDLTIEQLDIISNLIDSWLTKDKDGK